MGVLLMFTSGVLLFILDMLSLYQLNLMYGIGWAFAAFLIVPAHLFVPFIVGTWIPMLLLIGVFFFGSYLANKKSSQS
jgi:hypothetical protein